MTPKTTQFRGVLLSKWNGKSFGRTKVGNSVMKLLTDAMAAGNTVSSRERMNKQGEIYLDAEILWDADNDLLTTPSVTVTQE